MKMPLRQKRLSAERPKKSTLPKCSGDLPGAPIYKMPQAPAAKRVQDLLARMTLKKKAAQVMCVWQEKLRKLVNAQDNFKFSQNDL